MLGRAVTLHRGSPQGRSAAFSSRGHGAAQLPQEQVRRRLGGAGQQRLRQARGAPALGVRVDGDLPEDGPARRVAQRGLVHHLVEGALRAEEPAQDTEGQHIGPEQVAAEGAVAQEEVPQRLPEAGARAGEVADGRGEHEAARRRAGQRLEDLRLVYQCQRRDRANACTLMMHAGCAEMYECMNA